MPAAPDRLLGYSQTRRNRLAPYQLSVLPSLFEVLKRHYTTRFRDTRQDFFRKAVSLPTPRGEDPHWPGGRRKARE